MDVAAPAPSALQTFEPCGRRERPHARTPTSPSPERSVRRAADLKLLERLAQARVGSSNRKRPRIIEFPVPVCFRSSCQRVLPPITNFGRGALDRLLLGGSLDGILDRVERCELDVVQFAARLL